MKSKSSNNESMLCPSYIAKPGAKLFGYAKDGKVELLPVAITVDADFVEKAKQKGVPEKRLRFTGKCIEGSCAQWDGNYKRCGLGHGLKVSDEEVANFKLQFCPIRDNCRWYNENGKNACVNCTSVVRNAEEQRISTNS